MQHFVENMQIGFSSFSRKLLHWSEKFLRAARKISNSAGNAPYRNWFVIVTSQHHFSYLQIVKTSRVKSVNQLVHKLAQFSQCSNNLKIHGVVTVRPDRTVHS